MYKEFESVKLSIQQDIHPKKKKNPKSIRISKNLAIATIPK